MVMERTIMLSNEFLEHVAAGRKVFDSIDLNYVDFDGRDFNGLTIRNAKLLFTSMRHCTFQDVTFENCEFFFFAFGHSTFVNVNILGCQFDYGGFIGASFKDSKMAHTRLSWSVLIDANLGGLEMEQCAEFKVFRHPSEITYEDAVQGLNGLQPFIEKLDFDMKQKVGALIQAVAERTNTKLPGGSYQPSSVYGDNERHNTMGNYNRFFDATLSGIINAYGGKMPYKHKEAYEHDKSKYK